MNTYQQEESSNWFKYLQQIFIKDFERIEIEYSKKQGGVPGVFKQKTWERNGGGGGKMAVMYGQVFEKVGVNFSKVSGDFPKNNKEIPGINEDNRKFFASGISIVAHMNSPLIPSSHFNTRYLETTRSWFGGGADLTPTYSDTKETKLFHNNLRDVCNKYNKDYYNNFKKECDKYFFLKHRNEARGVGGIFFDYMNNNHFDKDFNFIQDLGKTFNSSIEYIIRNKLFLSWLDKQKEDQLIKRGRYVEFNLLYDRGTKFGLDTNGNIEAILMSMPPMARWK